MNRTNYAAGSRIVIDGCKSHGSWFDREELRQIVEFIRSGGAELAKQRQRDKDVAKKRWENANRKPDIDGDGWYDPTPHM
jgi:Zn-finger nucleic acid-binding protein